jgi:LuxR family transcriptional regulator, maltose regulon positive regulatory protein
MSALQAVQAWGYYDSPTSAKFAPPNLPCNWARRDRLNRQLSLAVQRPLTIVTGPPGAGKSVLLADWAHEYPKGVVAWLSVEEADNDLGQFWGNVAAALDGGQPAEVSIGHWDATGTDHFVERLVQRAAEGSPRILIVDDFHLVTDKMVIESVARLVRRLPASLRLVLVGQGDPGLPLQRVISSQHTVTITESDLRFTVDECAALVALAAHKFIPLFELEALTERSEGWAAGLHLAAQALADIDDPSEFVRSFSGAFSPVAEYIEHEMLLRQPPSVVKFLLQTSVLEHLTADVCRAVSSRDDSAELLASLARRNLFVVPLGPEGREYRYHRLFADVLRSRLQLEDTSLGQDAHFAAASWFERGGDARSAARHFVEAGAYERAFSLVFTDLAQGLGDNQPGGASALSPPRLTNAHIEQGPAKTYVAAAAMICAQRVGEAAQLLRHLDAVTSDREDRPRWRGRAEFLWAVHAERLGDAAGVLDHCRAAEELFGRFPMTSGHRGPPEGKDGPLGTIDASIAAHLLVLAARAHVTLGQLNEAQTVLARLFKTEDSGAESQPGTFAMIACRQGRLKDAFRLGTLALQRAQSQGGGRDLATFDARLALAEVLFEHNELDLAQQQLEVALRLCRLHGAAHWVWAVEADMVRLMVAQGRPGEALSRLGRLRQLGLRKPPPHHLLQKLNQVEIGCRLSLGDLDGALLIARSTDNRDISCATRARIDIASGRPDRALSRLAASHSPAAAEEIRRLVLLACAEVQHGRALRADDSLSRAVEMARPEGYIRPFVEEAAQVLPLLRVMAASRPDPYLAQLIVHAERVVPAVASTGGSAVLEPLTTRERQVLGYLSSHLSGPEIAARIYVSPNTVKSHMKAIYRKIGAGSRAEAVATAVSLGLL